MTKSKRATEIERLEQAFWQSMVDGDSSVATGMLTEPALMVSGHGANKFDHAAYSRMAADENFRLIDYDLSDMDVLFPRDDVAVATYRAKQKVEVGGKPMELDMQDTTTWLKVDGEWRCVVHTESPVETRQ